MVSYFTNIFYIELYLKWSFLPWNIRFCWRRGYVEILKGRAVSFCRCADSAGWRSNTACRTPRNKRLVQKRKKNNQDYPSILYIFIWKSYEHSIVQKVEEIVNSSNVLCAFKLSEKPLTLRRQICEWTCIALTKMTPLITSFSLLHSKIIANAHKK